MALNDMADQGIPRKSLDQFYNHMAEMFAEQSQVQVLLEVIGWPVAEQPQWRDAASQVYWSGIRRQIGLGRIEGGHRALFRAAHKQYRYSQVLNALADDFADPEPSVPPRGATARAAERAGRHRRAARQRAGRHQCVQAVCHRLGHQRIRLGTARGTHH